MQLGYSLQLPWVAFSASEALCPLSWSASQEEGWRRPREWGMTVTEASRPWSHMLTLTSSIREGRAGLSSTLFKTAEACEFKKRNHGHSVRNCGERPTRLGQSEAGSTQTWLNKVHPRRGPSGGGRKEYRASWPRVKEDIYGVHSVSFSDPHGL